ncbi:zinc finger protein 26 [Lasius niger]|uniref:Zinc finger protein 26 n=1 Tax=Lasius niger TaxID=67767 RepID=A0A0J7KKY2_LASNI|nr:zinc finger protein 26 [Lasius niger]
MAERCRICLIDHGCMTDIHDESVEAKLKDLTKCTCIDVKYEENLPSVVCHVCLYKLDMWSEFKEQFIQSNKILLEQLEISEISDISSPVKDKRCVTENMKRKRLNRSEDSISDHDKKKSKADVSSSELTNIDRVTGQILLDTLSISDDNDKATLSKDSSRNVLDEPDNSKKAAENGNGEHTESKASLGPMRARLLPVRRGRNIERRKASTKRWVERKKALLAATGENVSDTDSIISDDAQLSPVQKARAKTNADKEAERQKRIAKVLKNLEINLTEKYTVIRDGDTDSDTRRMRVSNLHSSTLQPNKKNSLLNQTDKKNNAEKNISSLDSSMERENSPVSLAENNVTTDVSVKKPESQVDDETFTPYTLKSELVIGDVTYAVTSTLVLADKESLNNLSNDSKSPNVDESSQEKNTDIIDAVQLRRVNNPVTSDANSKPANKSVERCLNIEVEGNELAILKRVQVELADFVQKEMRHRIFGTNDSVAKTLFPDKLNDVSAISRKKLDQKLKGIIERAIKKNIESSMIGHADDTCGFTRFSPADTKAAMSLPKYQPKVIITRLDITKESKLYNINNLHVLKQAAPRGSSHGGPISVTSRKRQIVPPIRYNDYNISALDSDSDKSNDAITRKGASKTSTEHTRTHGNLATKKSPTEAHSKIVSIQRIENSSIVKVMDNGARWMPLFVEQNSTNEQKADYEDAIRIEGAITENHICGVCALTFNSRKDVEAHVRSHKVMASASVTTLQNENAVVTPPRQNKQKMMRCKRCHEIVEARFVKSHVCKTATEIHKCYVCNSMFRTEKLLVRHLESHDQSEFNIVNAIGNKKPSTIDVSQKTQSATPQEDHQKTETATKVQNLLTGKTDQSDIQSDKITSTGVKLDNAENIGERSKETYTCFVCDKIFTDEEVLKDHLQKHCDDLSEGEQSNSKEQYQCAICGDTLESDQALEDHVGKHLFDDEDDNPNLISINQDNKSNNETKETESYHCGQCSESFDSETLLEIHMQEHEEEVAIAEWEKQGMRVINQYQCMLCDELFDAEEDLAEHLDIHNANAHVCQLCDKPFRTLEDLQEHVATH